MTSKTAAAEKQRATLKKKHSLTDETPVVPSSQGAFFQFANQHVFALSEHLPLARLGI